MNGNTIKVLKPGSHVTVLNGIKGVVVAVMIEDTNNVSYKVMWSNNGDVKEMWFRDFVVHHEKADSLKIGFINVRPT